MLLLYLLYNILLDLTLVLVIVIIKQNDNYTVSRKCIDIAIVENASCKKLPVLCHNEGGLRNNIIK